MVTELGVGVSNKCREQKTIGAVITAGSTTKFVTPNELSAVSLHLQRINFQDGNITELPSGFPRDVKENTCLPCQYELNSEPILKFCSVAQGTVYKPGELSVGARTTTSTFGTHILGFKELRGQHRHFIGDGDLTLNANGCAAFVVHTTELSSSSCRFKYLEYANQAHCKELLRKARFVSQNGSMNVDVWQRTRGITYTQDVHCEVCPMHDAQIRHAFRVYRSIQLENTVRVIRPDTVTERYPPVTADDIFRTVLALKITDDEDQIGEYSEYSECGVFAWIFAIPFMICLTALLIMTAFAFNTWRWSLELVGRPNDAHSVGESDSAASKPECEIECSEAFWMKPILLHDQICMLRRLQATEERLILYSARGPPPINSFEPLSFATRSSSNHEMPHIDIG